MIAVTENTPLGRASMWRSAILYSFSCNSQIKCFRTHVDMDVYLVSQILSLFFSYSRCTSK
jgi:hypothetical protein